MLKAIHNFLRRVNTDICLRLFRRRIFIVEMLSSDERDTYILQLGAQRFVEFQACRDETALLYNELLKLPKGQGLDLEFLGGTVYLPGWAVVRLRSAMHQQFTYVINNLRNNVKSAREKRLLEVDESPEV